jgi:ribose 5-phosphate isomerase B
VAVAIASDHAGLGLKDSVVAHLRKRGVDVRDLGTLDGNSVDYPSYARPLAEAVARGEHERGILVCGTGTGMAIAANKVRGVRAANCTNEILARFARSHNDANVLCLGERVVGPGLALDIVDVFLGTPFEGGRHQRRVELIRDIENDR